MRSLGRCTARKHHNTIGHRNVRLLSHQFPSRWTFTQHHHHSSSASVMAAKRQVPPDWLSPPAPTPNYISRTVSVCPLRASVNVSKRQEEKGSCATGRLHLIVTRRVCQFHAEFDIDDDCRIVAIDGSRSLSEPYTLSSIVWRPNGILHALFLQTTWEALPAQGYFPQRQLGRSTVLNVC